jgi:predicted HAD superfamily phosphohydrolase YqeG
LSETVFLELDNIRYKWVDVGNNVTKITTTQIGTSNFSMGTISENSILKLNLKIKVLFLDLGNTLISLPENSEKFVAFPETDTLLNKLKEKGIEMAIISDGK